ncbi:hypothetical protein MUN82_16590 [Hymenobacter aerilatus]|uniref:Uncharacterized protein n=1 Tax=Hymenobacter aerilatus TaxID=2932251 RepID=A0A8T9SV04_9BACT|nr:hypothetical protein [Hymenobacter aerilatus]UOR04553.1 hypothetical protein MUN82_16590 [Hymenobacter aerilatus]
MSAFTSEFLFYALLFLCLLLAVGLSVAAWRRPNRQRLVLRLVAGLVAAAALWLIAYPPTRAVPGSRQQAILLMPGYQPDSLQAVLRQLGEGTQLWRYGAAPTPDTPTLHSLVALREQLPHLRQLHVLGRGLPSDAAVVTDSLHLIRHGSAATTGFRSAQWPRQLALGKELQVNGSFVAAGDKTPVWVGLSAAGKTRDSVQLKGGRGAFRLRYAPKATGLAEYELWVRRGMQLVAHEPVPVEVTTVSPLRVLLLTTTPGFEFNFLKNYLGTQQHRVALRTQVSKGLTQTAFLNQPTHNLSRLTPALLARYDVVVADNGTLTSLASAEAQAVRVAVQNQGVGLLLLAEPGALPRALPGRAAFSLLPRPTGADLPQPVRWPNAPSSLAAPLAAELRLQSGSAALATDARQRPVVGVARVGLGHVVVSTLAATYPWQLQTTAAAGYAAFWSRLLAAAARPAPATAQWQVVETWPRPHQPTTLRLESTTLPTAPPIVTTAQQPAVRLPLQQDTRLPEWATGQFWPATAGWHQVQGPGTTRQWFYVFAPTAWQAAEPEAYLASTTVATDNLPPATTRQPWPVGWFVALFVLAAGTLWLEEKL